MLLAGAFQQLGSIVGGVLINAFKPFIQALNNVMRAVINFATTVSEALGAIFGWEYQVGGGAANEYAAAADAAEDLEDATGGAAKKAKELNGYIAPWHEVNNMTSDEPSSGGGGGGGAGGAGGLLESGQVGEWVQKESDWKQYESDIDTLYELGDYIQGVLTDAMNSINWFSVYQSAQGFGAGLANFLNGLITPELFGSLGNTVAGVLNTVLYSALSFGETFEWTELGESIASGINHFFFIFDFKSAGKNINVWANGLLDTMIAGLSNVEWSKIGTSIGTFLAEIDFVQIGMKIGEAIWEAINSGVEFAKGLFSTAPIEATIATILIGIPTIVAGIGSLATVFNSVMAIGKNFALVLSPITSLFSSGGIFGAGGAIATASAPVLVLAAAVASLAAGLGYVFSTNESVRQSFSDAVSVIGENLQPALTFITDTVLPDLNSGWEKLKEILSPFAEFLNGVFTDAWEKGINPALKYVGETVIPTVTKTFENLWNNVLVPLGNFLGSILSPAVEFLTEVLSILWENVGVPLADFIRGTFSEAFEGVAAILNNRVIPNISSGIEILNKFWNDVLKPLASYLWDKFKPIFEDTFETIKELIGDLQDVFEGVIQFITGVFSGDWERAWTGIENIFRGVFNGVIAIAEDAINFVIRALNRLSFDVPDWVPEFGGENFGFNLKELSLPRLAKGGIVTKSTLAVVGENGAEAVMPLENNTGWISKLSRNITDNMGNIRVSVIPDVGRYKFTSDYQNPANIQRQVQESLNYAFSAGGGLIDYNRLGEAVYQAQSQVARENPVKIGDDEIFRSTQRAQRREFRRTGKIGFAGI